MIGLPMVSSLAERICAVLLVLGTSCCAVAQEEMNSAFVTVAVSDTLGGAIPNARVHALDRSSRNETEKLTGETGTATLRLQPGKFDLTVTGPPGFLTSIITDVDVQPGEHRRMNVMLKVKTSDCCIDFVDPIERIEPERAKFGDLEESTTAKTAIRNRPTTDPVDTSEDACAKSAHLRTYSNAVFVEEAADVVGYELVFQQSNSNSASALLYVYDGAPNKDGISVSGQISAGKVAMKGNWVQHLIEEPAKKQVVETYPVEISGTLDSKRFRGSITISGSAESLTLRRVEYIWLCKPKAQ
jgi:hypothetical protein